MTVLGLLGSVSFGFGLVTAIAGEIPKLDPRRQLEQEVNGYIYDSTGKRELAVLRGSEARTLVGYDEIAPMLRHAIVAIEDRRYWEHDGVDLRGIARAAWADIRSKRVVEGGSTITQQFVKNALDRDQRTIARKVREAALAWQLERPGGWSKQEILEAYLNTIYFGNGAYGVQQAARTYYQHGVSRMTIAEAALLAGIPSNPTRYDPVTHPRAAQKRRLIVLQVMRDEGKITEQQLEEADAAPLPDPDKVRLPGTEGPAQHFVNYVKQQLVDQYGSSRVFGGGLRVTSTIDLELQSVAREAISKWLTVPDGPSAALVAIDPRDGAVLAMVGGNNYRKSQFNLAVQSERQPGSAFKPFVLAEALDQGISPATRFDSVQQQIDLGDRYWVVSNYENGYFGSVDIERATIESDNAVYAQLTQLVGSKRVARMAQRLGIQSELDGVHSIGLGSEEVNPLELARAYASFATGGRRIDTSLKRADQPRVIAEVRDERDRPLLANRPRGERVLTPDGAAFVSSILQRVVVEGTGVRAQLDDRPVAGKTGTTENYGDAWFVGYTPQLVVAVWVGYPTTLQPMLTEFNGEPVTGGTFPALIWKTFAERALEHMDAEPEYFPATPSLLTESRLVSKRLTPAGERLLIDNGQCPSRREVVYFEGNAPTSVANCRDNEVQVPDVRGQELADAEDRLDAQPLTPELVFRPAEPLEPAGVVVDQRPRRGYAETFDRIILVVTKPLHGVIPDLVGTRLEEAELRLQKLKLEPEIRWGEGKSGTVLSQRPKPGLAAAPGLEVRLVVAR
ncbi:MAG: PBP1A family penicillin-binding protein [Gaiellaceae bacterium]